MIFGIVGEGGTGKSAITVAMSLDHLHKYDIIYTNIKGYNKNHSVEDIAEFLNTEVEIRHFENTSEAFLEVLDDIEILQAENENDEKFKILVMYDECHKALRRFTNSKDEDIRISDFLSEHRHYHTDFYFMTQGYKKIADMYKGEFKAWFVSVDDQFKSNPDEIMFKKMDKENKTKIGIKRFKKSTKWRGKSGAFYKVFDCYDSGDDGTKLQKQGLSLLAKRKYIFFFFVVLFLVALYFSYGSVTSMFSSDVEKNPVLKETVKKSSKILNESDSNTSLVEDFTYSDRFELLQNHISKNEVISNFSIIKCLYDVKRKLYIFDNRTLTQKNFDSLNELFLFEILNTQIISENVYKFEYLVNSDLALILSSNPIQADKKQKSTFLK